MAVATLTLDEPATRNALSPELLVRLRDGLGAALSDEAVRVIVLAHEGPVFCAGADLRTTGAEPDFADYVGLVRDLWTSPKPVVCVVCGAVRGGGNGLVAASDIIVATTDASFAFPEVRIGAIPAMVAAPVLAKVGRAAALELFLSADPVGAERARQFGLVTAVAADAEPFVASLLKGAPDALAATKRLINERPGLDDLDDLARLSIETFRGAEAREGIAAFREKRPPRWLASS